MTLLVTRCLESVKSHDENMLTALQKIVYYILGSSLLLFICYLYFDAPMCTFSALSVSLLLLLCKLSTGGRDVFDSSDRAVLVTGCDSGFGHHLAKTLDRMGFTVFAGCLFSNGKGAQTLAKGSQRLKVLQLDVTRDEDVKLAKAFVEANLPKKGLWAVVNNAGISDWGETEWNSIEDYKKVTDVNLFGPIRTSIAFLPHIRASKGRVVFVSSIFAFFYCLTMGAYSVSKRGLEAFADCLRVELSCFEVKVSIIQPGNFGAATNITSSIASQDIWDKLDNERKMIFNRSYIQMAHEYFQLTCKKGYKDDKMVIDAMVHALTAPKPKTRYLLLSTMDMLFFWTFPLLPTFIKDSLFSLAPIYCTRKAMLYSQPNL